LGSGSTLLNREKASRTSAGVHGRVEGCTGISGTDARRTLVATALADFFGRGSAAASPEDFLAGFFTGFLAGFPVDVLADFLAVVFGPEDGLRVIFDMIGIY
jgi:hypothetical protein